ncbi:putative ubiquitin family protein [Diaporthe ampelina]|uniref:Putative ubiquitin family protein n=1 Tax=Diaporthe ampelina TaxID=1214573 RepID=A0A0G2HYG2_9PEZI|nr:putative ubiquitin family protein [Diaporthe ampelina]
MSFCQHENNSPSAKGPGTPAQPEHLTIKVTDNNVNELTFKIKKYTQLKKLMGAFCERHGKAFDTVRFFSEGVRLVGHETPESLEMQDGDIIEVYYQQAGGNGKK